MTDQAVSLTRYIWRFAAFYAAGLVGLLALHSAGARGIVPSQMSLVVALASAISAGDRFVKDHRRAPDSGERHRLAFYSLMAASVVSLTLIVALIVAAVLATVRPDDFSPAMLAAALGGLLSAVGQGFGERPIELLIVTAIVLAIYYAMLLICYGWLLRMRASRYIQANTPRTVAQPESED